MSELNYKNKYMELRSKYMSDLDMAFRLGFEQGQQQAVQDQMAQAQAEQQQQLEMAAAQGQPGQPGQEGEQPPQEGEVQPGQPVEGQPSELDQHISKLESMIAKSEDQELKKGLESLISLRKAEIQAVQIKKSNEAIKGIIKALHKPEFKFNKQASHNLSSNAKQAVSMQHKIVNDLMTKMEEEEKRASLDIKQILLNEGITKK